MAPLLPKSHTFPNLLRLAKCSPSSSPTCRSANSSSFLRTAPGKKSDLGGETVQFFSSAPFLLFMALLYLLACTALPALLAGGMPIPTAIIPTRQHRVASPAIGVIDGSGNSGHRSVAVLLQNRRMALETPSEIQVFDKALYHASTRHQPIYNTNEIGISAEEGNKEDAVLVDYKEAAMKVSLLQALNTSYWNEYPIYENGTPPCIHFVLVIPLPSFHELLIILFYLETKNEFPANCSSIFYF